MDADSSYGGSDTAHDGTLGHDSNSMDASIPNITTTASHDIHTTTQSSPDASNFYHKNEISLPVNYDESDYQKSDKSPHYTSTVKLNIDETLGNQNSMDEPNKKHGSTQKLNETPKSSKAGVDNPAYQDDEKIPETNGKVKHDDSLGYRNGNLNGSPKLGHGEEEQAEAVNLELINLKPNGKDVAGPYENGKGISGIPVKKDTFEGGTPYDEYFVPVNEHRKYMRGEKLYVTKDKREKSKRNKRLCWSLCLIAVAAVVIVGVLAALGVIGNPEAHPIEEGRSFGGSSSADSVKSAGGLFGTNSEEKSSNMLPSEAERPPLTPSPPSSTVPNFPPSTETYFVEVPRALQSQFRIDNLEFTPELAQKNSTEFKELAEMLEKELKDMLYTNDDGTAIIDLKVIEFTPGSVIAKFRVGWVFKEGIYDAKDPLSVYELKSRLNGALARNDGYIAKYHISGDSITVEKISDLCKTNNNNGCEYQCSYNYKIEDFICECPEDKFLQTNGKTCGDREPSVHKHEPVSDVASSIPDQIHGDETEKESPFKPSIEVLPTTELETTTKSQSSSSEASNPVMEQEPTTRSSAPAETEHSVHVSLSSTDLPINEPITESEISYEPSQEQTTKFEYPTISESVTEHHDAGHISSAISESEHFVENLYPVEPLPITESHISTETEAPIKHKTTFLPILTIEHEHEDEQSTEPHEFPILTSTDYEEAVEHETTTETKVYSETEMFTQHSASSSESSTDLYHTPHVPEFPTENNPTTEISQTAEQDTSKEINSSAELEESGRGFLPPITSEYPTETQSPAELTTTEFLSETESTTEIKQDSNLNSEITLVDQQSLNEHIPPIETTTITKPTSSEAMADAEPSLFVQPLTTTEAALPTETPATTMESDQGISKYPPFTELLETTTELSSKETESNVVSSNAVTNTSGVRTTTTESSSESERRPKLEDFVMGHTPVEPEMEYHTENHDDEEEGEQMSHMHEKYNNVVNEVHEGQTTESAQTIVPLEVNKASSESTETSEEENRIPLDVVPIDTTTGTWLEEQVTTAKNAINLKDETGEYTTLLPIKEEFVTEQLISPNNVETNSKKENEEELNVISTTSPDSQTNLTSSSLEKLQENSYHSTKQEEFVTVHSLEEITNRSHIPLNESETIENETIENEKGTLFNQSYIPTTINDGKENISESVSDIITDEPQVPITINNETQNISEFTPAEPNGTSLGRSFEQFIPVVVGTSQDMSTETHQSIAEIEPTEQSNHLDMSPFSLHGTNETQSDTLFNEYNHIEDISHNEPEITTTVNPPRLDNDEMNVTNPYDLNVTDITLGVLPLDTAERESLETSSKDNSSEENVLAKAIKIESTNHPVNESLETTTSGNSENALENLIVLTPPTNISETGVNVSESMEITTLRVENNDLTFSGRAFPSDLLVTENSTEIPIENSLLGNEMKHNLSSLSNDLAKNSVDINQTDNLTEKLIENITTEAENPSRTLSPEIVDSSKDVKGDNATSVTEISSTSSPKENHLFGNLVADMTSTEDLIAMETTTHSLQNTNASSTMETNFSIFSNNGTESAVMSSPNESTISHNSNENIITSFEENTTTIGDLMIGEEKENKAEMVEKMPLEINTSTNMTLEGETNSSKELTMNAYSSTENIIHTSGPEISFTTIPEETSTSTSMKTESVMQNEGKPINPLEMNIPYNTTTDITILVSSEAPVLPNSINNFTENVTASSSTAVPMENGDVVVTESGSKMENKGEDSLITIQIINDTTTEQIMVSSSSEVSILTDTQSLAENETASPNNQLLVENITTMGDASHVNQFHNITTEETATAAGKNVNVLTTNISTSTENTLQIVSNSSAPELTEADNKTELTENMNKGDNVTETSILNSPYLNTENTTAASDVLRSSTTELENGGVNLTTSSPAEGPHPYEVHEISDDITTPATFTVATKSYSSEPLPVIPLESDSPLHEKEKTTNYSFYATNPNDINDISDEKEKYSDKLLYSNKKKEYDRTTKTVTEGTPSVAVNANTSVFSADQEEDQLIATDFINRSTFTDKPNNNSDLLVVSNATSLPVTETISVEQNFTSDIKPVVEGFSINGFSRCSTGQFQCKNGTSTKGGSYCVANSDRCDSVNDCTDGSDEAGCMEERCRDNFQCKNGQCLKRHLVCDGIVNCDDSSDEENCDSWKCNFDEMSCGDSRRCIPLSWKCDGRSHCFDGRDEQNCHPQTCDSNQFYCTEQDSCIPATWRCDGVPDCKGGDDEKLCECGIDQFKCVTGGGCIQAENRCDGTEQCPDLSDEWNCLRLADGNETTANLEVLVQNSAWNSICSDAWNATFSDLACQSLGYAKATSTTYKKVEGVLVNSAYLRIKPSHLYRATLLAQFEKTDTCDSIVSLTCQPNVCGNSTSLDIDTLSAKARTEHSSLEWPSISLLFNRRYQIQCTASIIAPEWVVTSYACLHSVNGQPPSSLPYDWVLYAGGTNFFDTSIDNSTTQERIVRNIISHPQAKYTQFTYNNNIALVQLMKPLNLGKNITALCLPSETEESPRYCVTAGWNMKKPGDSFVRQYLNYLPDPRDITNNCNSTVHYNGRLSSNMLCIDHLPSHRNCEDDQGAPLMCFSDASQTWKLRGLLSFDGSCGKFDHPSLFTTIGGDTEKWIENTIGSKPRIFSNQ